MNPSARSNSLSRTWFVVAAVLLIAGVGWLRAPWLDVAIWNLDEGSTMTMAQQVLAGDILYQDAVDHRSPLVPYVKALLFLLFGDWNAQAVHMSMAVALGGCAALLGWIGYRLEGKVAGVTAALLFVVLQFSYVDAKDSMCAHTEWFVLIFSTIAFTLFVRTHDRPRFVNGLLVGFFFSLSTLSKQPGILDFLVASIVVIFLTVIRRSERKQLGFWWLGMLTALLIPFGLVSVYFYWHGAFADYIYYTFTFNTEIYVPELPLDLRLRSITKPLEMAWHHVPAIAIVTAVGFLVSIPIVIRRTIKPTKSYPILALIALGWTCSGLVSSTLGGRGFAHYSATMIPGICLICATSLQAFYRRRFLASRIVSSGAFAAFAMIVVFQFAKHYPAIAEALDSHDDSLKAHGEIVQRLTDQDERIFIWGYYPEIYFHAQRRPANRFIYTNFVTGMIPWTNVDPFIDTAYAVAPNAAKKMAKDFAQHPPALIVDSQLGRGYVKYPIARQDFLWAQIVSDYAHVEVAETASTGMRFFRRLNPVEPALIAVPNWPTMLALVVAGRTSRIENESSQIEVKGPKGADRLELVVNNRVVSSLRHRIDAPIDVRFFIPGDHFSAQHVTVRASGPKIRGQSAPIDFSQYARQQRATPPRGPTLNIGEIKIRPDHLYAISDTTIPYSELNGAWQTQAPARIEYACPPEINRITFSHGMHPAHIHDSDGYDVAVNWIPIHGESQRLWTKRNTHRSSDLFQEIQHETVDLPPRGAGKLEIQFSTGAHGNYHHDRLFLGPIEAEPELPYFRMGSTIVMPEPARGPTNEVLPSGGQGRWLVHASSEIRWRRPKLLKRFSFDFGIDKRAYDIEAGNQTDGVQFRLDLQRDTGEVITLFDRTLDPLSRPEDRGLQHADITIPANEAGHIIFSTHPGPAENLAWDWAWVGNFAATTPAPPIQLNNGETLPVISITGHPSMWSKRDRIDKWNAHPPQHIIYHKPANLHSIVINFGLFEAAIRDAVGNRRSDGVAVTVSLETRAGGIREVYRRTIDPFKNPTEAGNQGATIPLPLGLEGRLILEVEAQGHDSFDWAYWGELTGQIWNPETN